VIPENASYYIYVSGNFPVWFLSNNETKTASKRKGIIRPLRREED
jgi:hypothetical protein